MNTHNDHSVWRVDRDYCSDVSEHSAEYKLGVQRYRFLEEETEERNRAKTIYGDKCQYLT